MQERECVKEEEGCKRGMWKEDEGCKRGNA